MQYYTVCFGKENIERIIIYQSSKIRLAHKVTRVERTAVTCQLGHVTVWRFTVRLIALFVCKKLMKIARVAHVLRHLADPFTIRFNDVNYDNYAN